MNAPAPIAPAGRLDRRDLVVLLLLAVPILLLFADPIFTGRVLFWRDVCRFFYPNYHYAAERLRAGALPLWDPYCVTGHPFLGSWYPGALYPLSFVYIVFPLDHALTAFVFLHSYLVLAAMYLLGRDLGLQRPAAVVSALTMGLSGFAISVVDNPNMLASYAWMPLVFLLVRRVVSGPSPRRVAAAAGVIALQVYAGGPEAVYFTWLVTGLYSVVKLLNEWGQSRRRPRGDRPRLDRPALALAGCFALGILLAAAQLVPFAEVYAFSRRSGGYGLVKAGFWSAELRDLWRFLIPDYMVNLYPYGLSWSREQHWLKSFYVGLVPLVLTGIALVRVRGRRTLFLAGMAVLGILLALGGDTLFWVVAYYGMPGLAGIQFPVKFMGMATFAVALLAGLGANWLVTAAAAARRRTLLATAGALLVAAACAGGGVLSLNRTLATTEDDRPKRNWGEDPYFPRYEAYENTRASLLRSGVVVLLSAGCAAWLGLTRPPRRAAFVPAGCLGLLLAADTGLYHFGMTLTAHPRLYHIRAGSQDVIDRLPVPSRVFVDPRLDKWFDHAHLEAAGAMDPLFFIREGHMRNWPLISKAQTVHGFVPITTSRYEHLYNQLLKRPNALTLPVVDFLNARLLVAAEKRTGRAWLDAARFKENPEAMDRATIVRRHIVKTFATDEEGAVWLVDEHFSPRREVQFEAAPPPAADPPTPPADRDRVEVLRYEPERLVIRVESTAPGFLVVSDQYFPGWTARVAGRVTKVLRANFCFRAVPIPAGVYTVEMVYRPWTVTAGLIAAGAALVACAVLTWGFRRPRSPSARG